MRSQLILVLVLALVGVGVAIAVPQFRVVLPSRASVKAVGVGVYEDQGCTKALTSIDWGILDPGASINKTVYIKNLSNVPVTLGLSSENWQPPEAATYISLSWNYDSRGLNPGQVLSVVLTLKIGSSISGISSFSFDIIITATG